MAPASGTPEAVAMGRAYIELLKDRDILQFQLQAYAASGDPEVKATVSRRYQELFELVQKLAGVGPDRAREFLATGMLCNLAVTLDLYDLLPDKLRAATDPS